MATFLDYDPIRGVEEWEDKTYGDNRLQIHYRQDVEPVIELAKAERINGLADKPKMKNDAIHLYARIPPVVILKLKYEYGVDIFNKDHLKRAFDLINQDFPMLKTTEKHHDLKGPKSWL